MITRILLCLKWFLSFKQTYTPTYIQTVLFYIQRWFNKFFLLDLMRTFLLDLAHSDTSSSDIDVVKPQIRKQVKLSSSPKDPQKEKSVPSSDEAFKSLFLPISDEALLFTDQDLYKERGAAPKIGNNFGSKDEETANRIDSKLSDQRVSQRDKYFDAEDVAKGQKKQQYKKKEILEGDSRKEETSQRNKNENEFQIQSGLKSLSNVRSADLKKANKAERVKRFQNVMIEKLEEQKKRSTRIRGNVLQRMEGKINAMWKHVLLCFLYSDIITIITLMVMNSKKMPTFRLLLSFQTEMATTHIC